MGVHPAVVKMRMAQKVVPGKEERIDLKAQPWANRAQDFQHGYSYAKRNGLASVAGGRIDPIHQLDRLNGLGVDTATYFKQAKQIGMNPADGVLKKGAGPSFP